MGAGTMAGSLGMPHQYLQIQDYTGEPDMIAPSSYETSQFKLPPWHNT